MKAIELEAQPREIKKRNRAKALRSSGRVPGVVYGQGNNRLVDVDNKQFDHIMRWCRHADVGTVVSKRRCPSATVSA